MAETRTIAALPRHLEAGLRLLERAHLFRTGANMATGELPAKVLALLNRLEAEGVDWVLAGAEAVNLYIARPRASADVDIIVRAKDVRKVRRILTEECEEIEDTEVHFRALLSRDPNRLELDVIESGSHRLFDSALDHATTREEFLVLLDAIENDRPITL